MRINCSLSNDWADDISVDHELKDSGDLCSDSLRNILVLVLEIFEELLAHFAVLGHFELDLPFQSAITRWLHVKIAAELLLLFAQTVPLLVDL